MSRTWAKFNGYPTYVQKKDPRPGSHQKPDPEPALVIINNLHDYKPNQPSF